MELNGGKLKDKALEVVNKLKANIKGAYHHLADNPSTSVNELAKFVQEHPDTRIKTKELLGGTFRFFTLKMEDDDYYLETRNNRILQLDVSSKGMKLVSYRSYRDFENLNTPIKLEQ